MSLIILFFSEWICIHNKCNNCGINVVTSVDINYAACNCKQIPTFFLWLSPSSSLLIGCLFITWFWCQEEKVHRHCLICTQWLLLLLRWSKIPKAVQSVVFCVLRVCSLFLLLPANNICCLSDGWLMPTAAARHSRFYQTQCIFITHHIRAPTVTAILSLFNVLQILSYPQK